MSFKNALKFLNQPYPYFFRGNTLWIFTAFIFVMGLSFNYFFRPFNVNPAEHKMDYFWISFIHTLVPLALIGIYAIVLSPIVKNEDRWTVKKEMILFLSFFLAIGICQFLIRDIIYDNPNNWSLKYLVEEIRNTMLVGLLFSLIIVPVNYIRLLKNRVASAQNLLMPGEIRIDGRKQTIAIKTSLISDDFQLNVNDFISAKADGNYVELYLQGPKGVEKYLKRMTIKELDQQLDSINHIFKSHRSYLINLHLIEKVNGNAQGYKSALKNFTLEIPVSRSAITEFETRLQDL